MHFNVCAFCLLMLFKFIIVKKEIIGNLRNQDVRMLQMLQNVIFHLFFNEKYEENPIKLDSKAK